MSCPANRPEPGIGGAVGRVIPTIGRNMRRETVRLATTLVAAATAVAMSSLAALALDISGAGATFPYPIYAKWAEAFKAKTGISMNYQSIGSGGGIKQIEAKTVDFGASDVPLTPDDLQKNGLTQFPMIMGGIVPKVYEIFRHSQTSWFSRAMNSWRSSARRT